MRRRLDTSKLFTRSLIATAVAAALAGPTITWAQSADATLRGRAAAGADITAKNVDTGATRHTKANKDGSYSLVGMPPGTYRVDAGPNTEQTITLSVSSTQTFDFVQGAAHDSELAEIVVSGTRLQEVRTSEVGGVVSLHDIEVTPQITRNFLEFADTIPGMVFTVDGKGNTSIRGGAEIDGNVNVYIDGVGMKDYVTGGGISGQSGASKAGDPGNPFPQLAIAEYKVISSNYKAEFDQVASAAITAESKSGTNTFSGEAFGNFTNQNMRADTPAEAAVAQAGNPKAAGSASKEYGFAQGGPIIQDVAHFFVTYEHKDLSLPNSVFPPGSNGASLATLQSLLPANIFSQYGPTENPFKEDLFFGKLDFEPSDRDRFELSDLTRIEKSTVGASGQVAASAAYAYENDNERLALRWQHSADNWVNDARVTYESSVSDPHQASNNPAISYVYWPSTSVNTQILQVNGQDPRSYFHYEQNGTALQDDFTLNNLTWAGDHTIKFGAKFKSVDLKARDASQGANYYYAVDANGVAAQPYQAVFTVNNPNQNPQADSSDRQFGVYFQDDWVPVERLTLNLGLRWDYETVPSWQNYQLPASVVSALNSPFPGATSETYAQALALGGININNYIGTGNNRSAPTNEFQPRLGFSFDFNNDERHVLFGGYGRSYDRNVFDTMSLERTKLALSEPTLNFYGTPYTFNGCTTPANASPTCVAWNPAYLNLATLQQQASGSFGEIDLTNNNLKNPYSDQFSLGIRNRVGDWNTSVAIAQINSYNQIVGHFGNRYSNGAYYQNGTQWGAQGVPGLGSLILWDNAGKDKNTELLVSTSKPYTKESHWGASFAYTYSNATQNNPYSYASNNQYSFDLPFPQQYPMLASSAVSRHRLVMTGSTDGPWGLLFGAKLTLATPMPVAGVEGCAVQAQCYGYNAYPVVGNIRDLFGERNVDVQVTKNFEIYHDFTGYVRMDVLNVFNTPYFDPGAANYSPNGGTSYPPPSLNTSGPILGVPFTVKLTFGLKW